MADHMKEPEKGKKPEKITTEGSPGGPHTPGEKAKRARMTEAQTTDGNNR